MLLLSGVNLIDVVINLMASVNVFYLSLIVDVDMVVEIYCFENFHILQQFPREHNFFI